MSDIKDKDIDGLLTELNATKVISSFDPEWRGHNDGIDKAIRFIKAYREGRGLFQDGSLDKKP